MTDTLSAPQKIEFRLRRFNPEVDPAPHWESYTLEVPEGLTVLEAVQEIKAVHDPTLAWRSSCRMGICGSCGMYINGKPQLACQTQVLHLGSQVVTVAPLPNYPNVKDLVPDLESMFEKHATVKPFLIPSSRNAYDPLETEFLQSPDEREEYGQFSICIKCGICMSACPTVATDVYFLGPQPLAQAYRYTVDSRDSGLSERVAAIDVMHGPYQCHLAGACSDACPKGVDPALGIQLLKRTLVLDALGLKRRGRVAPLAAFAADYKPNEKIPEPPPRTVVPEPSS